MSLRVMKVMHFLRQNFDNPVLWIPQLMNQTQMPRYPELSLWERHRNQSEWLEL